MQLLSHCVKNKLFKLTALNPLQVHIPNNNISMRTGYSYYLSSIIGQYHTCNVLCVLCKCIMSTCTNMLGILCIKCIIHSVLLMEDEKYFVLY